MAWIVHQHRARMICNSGDVIDGMVALNPITTLLGLTIGAPPARIDSFNGPCFQFSHFDDNGRAVYFEE